MLPIKSTVAGSLLAKLRSLGSLGWGKRLCPVCLPVDSKLSRGKQLIPVVLSGIDVVPEHILQHSAHTLSLAIRLGMVRSGLAVHSAHTVT